jgi:hypothetical protein
MRIKANELRIGNWIQTYRIGGFFKEHQISTGFEIDDYDGCSTDLAKPIPLTEEWLKRFDWGNRKDKDLAVSFGLTSGTIHFVAGNYYVECYTVHQLQNLYFALTGEELTIKTINHK